MPVQKGRYLINSVLRAAQVLESFSLQKDSFTNAEFSKTLGINKSSVTRLLYSLEEAGFLRRDNTTGRYTLTYKLYRIGNVYIQHASLYKEAMPVLSQLVEATRETVQLTVLEKNEVAIIERIETPQSIGLMGLAGVNLPAYCSATGKVLLAHLPDNELEDYFSSVQLNAYTPKTVTDRKMIEQELKSIKQQGYAVCNAELEKQVVGIASPLRDKTGAVIASISIAGPDFRIGKKRVQKHIIELVTEAADSISRRLGYFGPS